MKYLKYFESKFDLTLDKIREVFESIDLEYDVEVKVTSSPSSIYLKSNSERSPLRTIPITKYYINFNFLKYPDSTFGKYLIETIKKCEKYCDVQFNYWNCHNIYRSGSSLYGLEGIFHGDGGVQNFTISDINSLELGFIPIVKINESNDLDPLMIKDYFNDLFDRDISVEVESGDDEFGKFYQISIDMSSIRITQSIVSDLENIISRVCSAENLFFESSTIDTPYWGNPLMPMHDLESFIRNLKKLMLIGASRTYVELFLQKLD